MKSVSRLWGPTNSKYVVLGSVFEIIADVSITSPVLSKTELTF